VQTQQLADRRFVFDDQDAPARGGVGHGPIVRQAESPSAGGRRFARKNS
jgi:hypothetical protein